jgi:hypothetical protein
MRAARTGVYVRKAVSGGLPYVVRHDLYSLLVRYPWVVHTISACEINVGALLEAIPKGFNELILISKRQKRLAQMNYEPKAINLKKRRTVILIASELALFTRGFFVRFGVPLIPT